MHVQNSAFETAVGQLLDQRTAGGYWEGALSASALSTATAISALSFYVRRKTLEPELKAQIESLIASAAHWIVAQQNDDGGWGDTDKSYSNISTTMLVIAAFEAAEIASQHEAMLADAGARVEAMGGIAGLRQRYGKDKTFAVPILANCAMAGMVEWKEVAALPFEAACVPQRFYNLMQLPVVSYAIPALVAIGQCKFINDPPWDPVRKIVRKLAIGRSLKVLENMQPQSGGYLEAIPLTSFVAMALIESGRCDCKVVENSIRFLMESVRLETSDQSVDDRAGKEQNTSDFKQASWPIDTNLATWGTTLAINAIAQDRSALMNLVLAEPARWWDCFDWVLSCQHRVKHPFTGAVAGGWGWTDLSGAVPDCDDTPGALIALKHVYDLINDPAFMSALPLEQQNKFGDPFAQRIVSSAQSGVNWLLGLQNRDDGWPTFCKGWGKLPFDRSGADLTAHAIRALEVWKSIPMPSVSVAKSNQSIERGFAYLKKKQHPEGYWLPLWFGNQDYPDDINPCYGTAKVLQAYADCGLLHTSVAKIGLNWLVNHQRDDGGFGGGPSVHWDNALLGNSTVEETALCAEALLASSDQAHQDAGRRAIAWLEIAAQSDSIGTFHPIGFYFAKLWYHERLYPLVFSIGALARYQTTEQHQ